MSNKQQTFIKIKGSYLLCNRLVQVRQVGLINQPEIGMAIPRLCSPRNNHAIKDTICVVLITDQP